MSPSAVIGASPRFSRPTTIAPIAGIPVWAYCLMPNHVHLACADGDGWVAGDLCRGAPALYRGDQHRFRWTGHLFQGLFGAVVMDEPHLLAAARYIALNPVVAGLVSRAED
jgi:putative transposase